MDYVISFNSEMERIRAVGMDAAINTPFRKLKERAKGFIDSLEPIDTRMAVWIFATALLTALTLQLFNPTIANANIIDDFINAVTSPFQGLGNSIANTISAWVVSILAQIISGSVANTASAMKTISSYSVLTSTFDNLIGGEGSSAGLATAVRAIAEGPMLTCGTTLLSIIIMIQLFKIAKRSDQQGGNPQLFSEIFWLFFSAAIFAYLINHSFDIITGLFDMANNMSIAINNKLGNGTDYTTAVITDAEQSAFVSGMKNSAIDTAGEILPALGTIIIEMFLFVIIYFVTIAASVVAQFMGICRAIEVYILSAFAPLAFSFFGLDETRSWAMGYLKQFLTVALQGAILLIILYFFPYIVGASFDNILNVFKAEQFNLLTWTTTVTANAFFLIAAEVALILTLFKSGNIARSIFGS